jgi:hypothetical protein
VRFVADNEALLDAILYDWYPNALPGQLDDIDILRFWRMVEAKSVMSSEDERKRYFEGNTEDKPDARKLAQWAEHDNLLERFGLDG